MRIVSWNMQNLKESWRFLIDRHQELDFAFVQEACTPTSHVRDHAGHWDIPNGRWQVRPKKYKQEVLSISGRWTFDRLDRDTISALGPANESLLAPRFRAAAVARNKAEGQEVCLVCVVSGPKNSLKLANTVTAIRRRVGQRSGAHSHDFTGRDVVSDHTGGRRRLPVPSLPGRPRGGSVPRPARRGRRLG